MVFRRRSNELNRRSTFPRCGQRLDDGFTLIELLVVSIILPLVIGALSLGIVAVFSQQSQVTGRLAGSTDLQMTTATFIRDVESASTLTNQPTPQVCGTIGTQLLGLTWSGGQTNVSYVEVQGNGSGSVGFDAQLQRLYCVDGSATPTSVMVVSNGVSTVLQNPPAICTSSVSPCATPPSYPAPATSVSQVSFSVYVPPSTTPYVMVASPRLGRSDVLTGGPNSSTTPIVLTSTTCGTVLTINNGGQLWINVGGRRGNGVLTVESPCAGKDAIPNSGDSSRGNLCVSAIISGSRPLGNFTNPNGTCPGPKTPPWYYSDSFVNPLANIQLPPPPLGPGTCSVQVTFQNGYTCSAGSYTKTSSAGPKFSGGARVFSYPNGALPSFPNNSFVHFTGGAFSFSVPVPFRNGVKATFDSGTYNFESTGNALTFHKNASVTGNNVLFYAPNGNITFGNNDTVALSANPDPNYYGVAIWDGPKLACPSTGGPYSVTLANNGSGTYGGIYAPCAEVGASQNVELTTTFIVASTASFRENTKINVTTP